MIAKDPKPHISPRVLLLLGQPEGRITQFHNQPAHWASLGSLLRACDARSRVVTDDIRVLTPETLASFDVIVNASTALRPSDREYFAIQSRIDAGAGYAGGHVANTVHLTSPDFPARGGRAAAAEERPRQDHECLHSLAGAPHHRRSRR